LSEFSVADSPDGRIPSSSDVNTKLLFLRKEKEQKFIVSIASKKLVKSMRFQVLMAASMMFSVVFWDVLPCKMIVDRRFRGAYSLKRRSTIILHGSTSQKTILNKR
jgi:hypothetical protein